MSEDMQPKPVKTTSLMRRVIIYAVVLLVVFLVGFVPAWLQSRECSSSLSQAERQLGLARIENALASAAIDARRGDYEPARQAASIFFTSLRAETDKGADSAFSAAQREGVPPLVAGAHEQAQRIEDFAQIVLSLARIEREQGEVRHHKAPLVVADIARIRLSGHRAPRQEVSCPRLTTTSVHNRL